MTTQRRQEILSFLNTIVNPAPVNQGFTRPYDPLANKWRSLIPNPCVAMILGKRGSGKSALGYYLLEILHGRQKAYVVGFPEEDRNLLPDWCKIIPRLEEAPNKAVILVDEAYAFYQSRESYTSSAKSLLPILGMSRKKKQTLIFIAHESRQVDINVIGHVDVLVAKQPSLFQKKLDRPAIRDIIEEAKVLFASLKGKDMKRCSYVISDPAAFEGVMQNPIASFWNETMSDVFVEVKPNVEMED